jgi:hypothetical protein
LGSIGGDLLVTRYPSHVTTQKRITQLLAGRIVVAGISVRGRFSYLLRTRWWVEWIVMDA